MTVNFLLPVGTEYEQEYLPSPLSGGSGDTIILRFRVVEHIDETCRIEVISQRNRPLIKTYSDGFDIYGQTVMRGVYDGDPPFPTHKDAMILHYNTIKEDPKKQKQYRRLSCSIASSIIGEMAKSYSTIEYISMRINRPEAEISEKLNHLINGVKFEDDLNFISDVLLAMGAELDWSVITKTNNST